MLKSNAAEIARVFAPPPAGTPIEKRLSILEAEAQAILILLCAQEDTTPSETRPQLEVIVSPEPQLTAPRRSHLYLVEN